MGNELDLMLENRDYNGIRELLGNLNTADIAETLENIDEKSAVIIFRMMPKDKAADIFANFSHDMQRSIVEAISDRELNHIIEDMFMDDAVDFVDEMPANVVKRVLANASPQTRQMINQLLQYPKDSAGSIMTTEYVDLKKHRTVKQAFEQIRKTGVDKETIYTCYVIAPDRKLIGMISAKTLLLSNADDIIDDIMEANVISVKTTDDQESITEIFRKYGMLALPVVDHDNRLVGIVTIDDALSVQEEEATEDFQIMAAMSPSEEPYLKTSVLTLTRNRILWLMLLMLSATITGSIIMGFEEALSAFPVLVAYIPMLMDTGGNSGSQSSTLIIRGMALNEVSPSDFLKVWWKEIRVALLCGGALSVVNLARMMLLDKTTFDVAITVCITLFLTVLVAKSIGCLLPMFAKKLHLDPAVMASPIITTIVDATSLSIYFVVALRILPIAL